MTDQPMDYRDYLIRQHEQERMAQRFEALFSKSDEDHAAEQAELVSQQAYDTAEECAVGASEVEEALTEVVTEAGDLRKRIEQRPGVGEGRAGCARQPSTATQGDGCSRPSIKTVYEGAVKTIEDPAARVAALKNKYPALRAADHGR